MRSTSIPPYEDTIFEIAYALAKHATCPRKSVGCVIVSPMGAIVSSGYNSSPHGYDPCFTKGCVIEGGHCVRAVHAEITAITSAANRGIRLYGCSAYCTLLPCIQCMNALYLAGLTYIMYDEEYEREEKKHLFEIAERNGVYLVRRAQK